MKRYYDGVITKLKPNEVFVFGSNIQGAHGAGAALLARMRFGAIPGRGFGQQGQSFAIATRTLEQGSFRTLPLGDIRDQVETFLDFAKNNPAMDFWVTAIGTGYAGYQPSDIAPMFEHNVPYNVILPIYFYDALKAKEVDPRKD